MPVGREGHGGYALIEREEERRATVSELAVVDAPRVRELGLYAAHNEAFVERFGKQAELGANDEQRPWEAVALGRQMPQKPTAPYVRARLFPALQSGQPGAEEAAEIANAQALEGYKSKNWRLCYEASSEAIRLNTRKKEYYTNRAAAALKIRGLEHLRQAVYDCRDACSLDPTYVKGYVRSAEAHFAMGEPHTVRMALELYEKALHLNPGNQSIEAALQRVKLVFGADYDI